MTEDQPVNPLTQQPSLHPRDYSPQTSTGLISSTRYALAGLAYLRHQAGVPYLLACTVLALGLGLWLQIPVTHYLLLLLALGLIWVAEAINTAIESVVNLVTHDYHPMAKVSKDCASAATFIASVLAFVVALITLLPPLIVRFAN